MKIFYIDGGIGRAIASIPSLLKYHKNHLNEEWYVMICGFDYVTWGIPELQDRTFNPDTKGVWENIFLKADSIITVEPYRVPNFYKQKINLAESFDEIINETTEHSDLEYEVLQLSQGEIKIGRDVIYKSFEKFGKDRTVVINPYGSSAHTFLDDIWDDTMRSMPEDLFLKLSKFLSEDYNVIYMGYDNLISKDLDFIFIPESNINIREWMGIIGQVDYVVGCDSVAQHIARFLGTKSSVFMSSTSSINMSYPDKFLIFEKEHLRYMPLRISQLETNLSSKVNKKVWNYSDEEIYNAYLKIKEDIESIPL
jgi:ADP-heptose:LPS heptosyltransferase